MKTIKTLSTLVLLLLSSNICATNIAPLAEATASSNYSSPNLAIDGDTTTRWETELGPADSTFSQWYQLELDQLYDISQIVIMWEAAVADIYSIDVSNDKQTWTEVYAMESRNGGLKDTIMLSNVEARYIRVNCEHRLLNNWGYSIWEIEVYGLATANNDDTDAFDFLFDFESGMSYWYSFAGATTTIVNNPDASGINTSKKVSKMIKNGGQHWAGAYLTLSAPIDFKISKEFKMKVFTPAIGTKVLFKLENKDDNTINHEIQTESSLANEWEELTFNFSDVDVTKSYHSVVVIFDIETLGDGSSAATYYLDDIIHTEGDNNGGGDDTNNLEGYTLIWSDEFDEEGTLDESKWFHQTQLPNGGSWYNGEVQHYTNRTTNSFVESGIMKLVAKKENFTDQDVTKEYTSARLNSKFAFTYGRVEVKAKLPSGVGTWPAIWMLGKNISETGAYWQTQGYGTTPWPACGEIDIMEHWGSNENVVSSAMHTPSSFGGTVNKGEQSISNATNEYHVYAMDWDEERIIFSVDNVVHYTYNPEVKNADTWPYDADQYLLMNIAIQNNISTSFIESSMDVDFVRVYQKSISALNNKSIEQLSVYPNPAQDFINLSNNTEIQSLSIYNMSGIRVFNVNMPENNPSIDIQSIEPGIYFIIIENQGTTERVTFIKR